MAQGCCTGHDRLDRGLVIATVDCVSIKQYTHRTFLSQPPVAFLKWMTSRITLQTATVILVIVRSLFPVWVKVTWKTEPIFSKTLIIHWNCIFICKIEWSIIRNWFTKLWRLGSSKVCSWQPWDPGQLMIQFTVQVPERTHVLAQSVRLAEFALSLFILFQFLIDWMRNSHIRKGIVCPSLRLLSNLNHIQKHPHRHTQNNIWPNVWASHGPIKLTHKINYHTSPWSLPLPAQWAALSPSCASPHGSIKALSPFCSN